MVEYIYNICIYLCSPELVADLRLKEQQLLGIKLSHKVNENGYTGIPIASRLFTTVCIVCESSTALAR